jgi:hypothetical protein
VTYQPPTTDEITRVAEYWRRVELLNCEHRVGFTFTGESEKAVCSDCHQPLNFLTDIQLEQRRLKPEDPTVREKLLAQMKRGGVCFEVDGEWYDARFLAYRLPGWNGNPADSEIAVMKVTDVELLLRATDSR